MSSPKRTGKTQANHHGSRYMEAEDAELWAEVAKSITPLRLSEGRRELSATQAPYMGTTKKYDQTISPILNATPDASVNHPPFEHGKAPGLDRKTQTRMRRGQVQIEGRLDLHGMTQTKAHRALLNFLEGAYYEGRRSVLVITGKGLSKDGEVGVLRRAVPRWLNEQPMNAWIKGFDHAARQHGGEGAIYVLIRRKR